MTVSRPSVEWVSPYDVWIDPTASSVRDARWVCQRVWRTVEEVHNDKSYKKNVREVLQGSVYEKDRHRSSWGSARDGRNTGGAEHLVDIYEFWDIQRNLMGVFSDTSSGYLIDPIDWPYTEQPFEMLELYRVPGEIYGLGEVQPLLTLENEADATRTQMMENRRNTVPKFLVNGTLLNDDNQAQLESPEPGAAIVIDGATAPLKEAVVPLQLNSVPSDLYRMFTIIREDMNRLSALDDVQRGADGEIRKSATEAAIRHREAQGRSAEKSRTVERAVARVAMRMIGMAQQLLRKDVAVRLLGPKLGEQTNATLTVGREMLLAGEEFDFSVELGSAGVRDESSMRQEALLLFQTLSPLFGTIVDPKPLVEDILRAYNKPELERYFIAEQPQQQQPQQPQPQPQQQPALPPGGPPPPQLTPPQEEALPLDGTAGIVGL